MIKLDNIVGDIIYITFKNYERYKDIGIMKSSGHFLLKGYDKMGLWLEHPGIVFIHNIDETGNTLPVSKHTKENIAADFIVTWENVNTLMQYPNREGFDFLSEFNKKIGFHFESENQKI